MKRFGIGMYRGRYWDGKVMSKNILDSTQDQLRDYMGSDYKIKYWPQVKY